MNKSRTYMMKYIVNAVFVAFTMPSAHAATISGIFNTGVDDTGQVLPVGSSELHYELTGPISPASVVEPNRLWIAAPAGSAWIGPTSGNTADPLGDYDYTYTLTFDLTSLDHSTATITGEWATDNDAVILLNNVNTGITNIDFLALYPFSISDGYIPGINTLQFVVTNQPGSGSNPTGLLIANLSGEASVVPIPAAVWLFGSGLLGMIGVARRKKTA
jgi:hypothetical protein